MNGKRKVIIALVIALVLVGVLGATLWMVNNWQPVVNFEKEQTADRIDSINQIEQKQLTTEKKDTSKEKDKPVQNESKKIPGNQGRPFGELKKVASPVDSSVIAYIQSHNESNNLFVEKEGQTQQLTYYVNDDYSYFRGVGDFDWSPDGSRIVFTYSDVYPGVSSDVKWCTGLAIYDLNQGSSKVIIPSGWKNEKDWDKGNHGAFGPRWVKVNGKIMLEYETIVLGDKVYTEPGEVGHWHIAPDGKTYCFGQEYWIERRLISCD
jgi:hypothetical protein